MHLLLSLVVVLFVLLQSATANVSILQTSGYVAASVPTYSYFGDPRYIAVKSGLPVQLFLDLNCQPILEQKDANRLPGMKTWKESILWFEWDDARQCGFSHYAQLFPLVRTYNESLVASGAPPIKTLLIFTSYLYRFKVKMNPLLEPYRPQTLGQEYSKGFRPPSELSVLFVAPKAADRLQAAIDGLKGQRWAFVMDSSRDAWNEMKISSLFNYFRYLFMFLETMALAIAVIQLKHMLRIKTSRKSFFLGYLCANIVGIVLLILIPFLPMLSLSTWVMEQIVHRWFCATWVASLLILSSMKSTFKREKEAVGVACGMLALVVVGSFVLAMVVGPQPSFGSIEFTLLEYALPAAFYGFALVPLAYVHYLKNRPDTNVALYNRVFQVILVWLLVLTLDEVVNLRVIRNNWYGFGPLAEGLWIIVGGFFACVEAVMSASAMLLLYSRRSTEEHQDGVVDWFGRQKSHNMTA